MFSNYILHLFIESLRVQGTRSRLREGKKSDASFEKVQLWIQIVSTMAETAALGAGAGAEEVKVQ